MAGHHVSDSHAGA